MDRAPGKLPKTSSRLIALAASLVGDAEAVRTEMGCPAADFRDYCAGRRELPSREFDRLISLIIREEAKVIGRNRRQVAAVRARLRNRS